MNRITPQPGWPESWLQSYDYDRLEIYGEYTDFGYVYAYQNRMNQTLDMIGKVVASGARILDVAGAQGNFSLALAEHGYDVTWNDLRSELIDYIKLKQSSGSITFQPGNVLELAVDEPFDLVLMCEVIEHVAHPDDFLRKISSFVRPGGYIVLTTPCGHYFRNKLPRFSDCPDPSIFESVQFQPDSDGHIFLLHEDELRKFSANADLDVEEIRFFTSPLTNGHVKTEAALRLLPKSTVDWLEAACQNLPRSIQRKICNEIGAILRKKEIVVAENSKVANSHEIVRS